MGEHTNISWTDSTWNCWQGCRKVSPGCQHCYAEALVENRMGRSFRDVRRSQAATFNAPLRWKRGRRIFTCSISDFFIEEADGWRDDAWEVIRRTPQHTYQILTKRPERILDHLPGDWDHNHGWPHVWLGTSVETQRYADLRVPQLLKVPAKIHFLSCEPLLGPLDLRPFLISAPPDVDPVGWVIVGGESGPNFRVMDLDWARRIHGQCETAGVPFFFKQRSALRPESDPRLDGRDWKEMPK